MIGLRLVLLSCLHLLLTMMSAGGRLLHHIGETTQAKMWLSSNNFLSEADRLAQERPK